MIAAITIDFSPILQGFVQANIMLIDIALLSFAITCVWIYVRVAKRLCGIISIEDIPDRVLERWDEEQYEVAEAHGFHFHRSADGTRRQYSETPGYMDYIPY